MVNKRTKVKSAVTTANKFKVFNDLINENEKAHLLMSGLSDLVQTGKPFNSEQANSSLELLFKSIEKMVGSLESLTGRDYPTLKSILNNLKIEVRLALIPKLRFLNDLKVSEKAIEDIKLDKLYNDTPYTYDLNQVDEKFVIQVGNKMSRLGEIKNNLKLPVPDGFCVSIKIFDEILSHNNLRQKKNALMMKIDFNKFSSIKYVCNQVQAMILAHELPEIIEKKIQECFILALTNKQINLAVRSSAFGEDSEEHSFAGLHKSFLNVNYEYLIDAVINVLTSFYNPQSVIYRYISGIRDEDMPLSVGCMEMVDAQSAGVLYTKDPNGVKDGMIIQAVSGLGTGVVEGIVKPQEFIINKSDNKLLIEYNNSRFEYDSSESYLTNNNLLSDDSCLRYDDIIKLYQYSKIIEDYFGLPQDIEWALSRDGNIYILQARPLKLFHKNIELKSIETQLRNAISKNPVIIRNGDCASNGIAYGKVFKLSSLRDINRIPDDAILVARKNFLELTSVIHKTAAIITDIGSTTGHLAIIAREMKKPLITNTENSTELLENGDDVTVFADFGLVFGGKINDILKLKEKKEANNPFLTSPVYSIWSKIINNFFKLNLTDNKSQNFREENCKTIHDLIRFVHETCMKGMFEFYSDTSVKSEKSYKLNINIPLELYVIDLGDGLKEVHSNKINVDDIESVPFLSLIEGMLTPGLSWSGFVPLDTKGFAEMIMSNVTSSDTAKLLENSKSYAFIADNYVNFFSQLGYHFSRLDVVATDYSIKNYINFNFRGGASTDVRKARRANAILRILEKYDFSVSQIEDDVYGRIKGIPKTEVCFLTRMLGRLMGEARSKDVTMISDNNIDSFVESFMNGEPVREKTK